MKFLTQNEHKFKEFARMMPGVQLEMFTLDAPEIQSMDPDEIIREKLAYSAAHMKRTGQLPDEIIVEDTSLGLSCMKGLPGPLIKWFVSSSSLGAEGLANIVLKLGDQKATALTVIGFLAPGRSPMFFRGFVEGTIIHPNGSTGFSWDNIFVPNGSIIPFSEMEPEVKDSFSMRGIAIKRLMEYLRG